MLLCAEDDDLGLIEVVHLGRILGLDLEVIPGIEDDLPRVIKAARRRTQTLFAIVGSPNLSVERTLTLEDTLADAAIEGVAIVTLELTQDPHSTLQPALDELLRLEGWMPGVSDDPPSTSPGAPVARTSEPQPSDPTCPTGPLSPVPQLDPIEHEVTSAGNGERTDPLRCTKPNDLDAAPWQSDAFEIPRRVSTWHWALLMLAAVGMAAGAYALQKESPSPVTQSPEVQIIEAAAVPADIDELPSHTP